ncbi:conserved membrane hypothetical protein [Candidatus Zixiibacteriota bacterium]|nr:conserved membrane hypothetical protein [candidate division Zixibacteria bacterium]
MSKSGFLQGWDPQVLSILRIMAGFLLLFHGTMKLFNFPASTPPMQIELFSLMGLAGVLEAFGGFLLFLGLFTRPVAFILCGEMAVAYFKAHAPQGFLPIINHGELAVIYCFVFLYLTFAGGGPWSLDSVLRRVK